jgi:hypothetical protein
MEYSLCAECNDRLLGNRPLYPHHINVYFIQIVANPLPGKPPFNDLPRPLS